MQKGKPSTGKEAVVKINKRDVRKRIQKIKESVRAGAAKMALAVGVAAALAALQGWSRPTQAHSLLHTRSATGAIFVNVNDTVTRDSLKATAADSALKTIPADSLKKSLADSIKAAAFDKYVDSLASLNLSRDSLRRMGLSADVLSALDSLYRADSLANVIVYTEKELRRMRRDSIRQYHDSIIRATPRVLTTYLFPDSIVNTRMFVWKHDTYVNSQELLKTDTTFNYHFNDLPFRKKDVGAQYLGMSGSAALSYNYFKRETEELFPFFDNYTTYTYSHSTHPFYNVKTPYTELGYWGTLFANREKTTDNVHFLHTQNFTPSFNFAFLYNRNGGKGLLQNEATDFRTLSITGNYIGKRYVAQGGYLFSRLKRNENGGITEISNIRDTTIDVRTIPVYMTNASSIIRRNSFFITHSYGVPIRWKAQRDSLGNKIDTLGVGKGTVTYFGHHGEYTVFSRSYTDVIALSDSVGRSLYNNKFFINPTTSNDSVRVMNLENRFFIKLQPWGQNSIVSTVDAGIGHQMLSLYTFHPDYFISGNRNHKESSNLYVYFGARGQLRKYYAWNALAKIDYAGYYKGNYSVEAAMRFSSWAVKEGIHLTLKLHSSLKTPSYFYSNLYTNHYIWNNNFDKISQTKLEALLSIPHWGLEAQFGYALLNKNLYLDSLGNALQNTEAMSVLSGYLSKKLHFGPFHMDNRLLFQVSSKEEVLPLPKFALNLRYYFQFYAVKNVLNVQIGADVTYNTKYYAQAFSPALGMFYNQKDYKVGNNPYIDAFINLQWKRACIFVKVENVAMGWPNQEYFSTYRYIRPQRALKLGIWWPFYIK